MRYIANLTNNDDLNESGNKVGFGTGKYGFELTADNMAEARQKVIDRAKKDGFYGFDWRAKITRLKPSGLVDTGSTLPDICSSDREIVVNLNDSERSLYDLHKSDKKSSEA